MDVELESVLKTVNQFVAKTRGAPKKPIAADTLLYQEGHIDSFGLVELIADLERSLDVQLPPGTLIPEDFESPRGLWTRITQI
jgi:acyl carrier protein